METRVAVVGAGSWGTTIAHVIAAREPVRLWARRPEVAAEINETHRNSSYLAAHELNKAIVASSSMSATVANAEVVAVAVPSQAFRGALATMAPHLSANASLVSLTKGFEEGSMKRMTEVCAEVVPGHSTAVLTGPNLANEIMDGFPAASVVATADEALGAQVQGLFAGSNLRIYTHHDVVGAETGGALKNVIAIACGVADGLGAGDNSRAAIITRGLAELTRLGVSMGGVPITFAGLAGLGDLVATAISPQSRNRHVGEQLGRGRDLPSIIAEMNMVAEGVKAAQVALRLAREHGVEMPIANLVAQVCDGGISATEAFNLLLARDARPEVYGFQP